MANPETPDIVYGRLLESVHISGYSFERVVSELEWLLEEDRWKRIGQGYEHINDFIKTVDLSPWNMDKPARKRLSERMKELGASTREAAKALGVSNATVSRDATVTNVTPEPSPPHEKQPALDPTVTNVTPAPGGFTDETPKPWFQRPGEAVAEQAEKATRKEDAAAQTRARREASRNAPPLPDGAELRIGDAREVLTDVEDNSIALVLTDPPYGDEAKPLYQWLSEWASRVLVPGGSLICYTGQSRLDRDINIFSQHLRYWWLLTMLHDQSQRLPGKFVMAEFKPVLWFVKENRRSHTLVNDVLRSPKREKGNHDWGQGDGGVRLLIEQLTSPDELIADPFAGTALWGKIAANMGRRWIGADIKEGGATEVLS